jgi:membrane dipeptidase
MDDEMLMAMKTNGGVVQMVALFGLRQGRIRPNARRRSRAAAEFALPAARRRSGGGRGAARGAGRRAGARRGAARRRGAGGGRGGATARLDTLHAGSARRVRAAPRRDRSQVAGRRRATVKDFVDHIDYAVKLIGIDHVGISSDFDGGGGIDGWNSAAETFNVTLELVRRGYTEEQIGKIWSGNLLRVWGEVEKVAKEIQAVTLTRTTLR